MDYLGTVRASLETSGISLAEVVFDVARNIPIHSHEIATFCLALEGECVEFYKNEIRRFKPLTSTFLPADHPHSVDYFGKLRWFRIQVSKSWLEKATVFEKPLAYSVHSYAGPLSQIFLRLYKEFREREVAMQLAIEGLVLEMLVEVSRISPTTTRRPPRWLLEARQILDEHLVDSPKLSSIAKRVGVHPVHLAREFRRYFNYTTGEYIRDRRISFVCELLVTTDTSLAEIAHNVGFTDQSHLSRLFKLRIGTTPSEYRKTYTSVLSSED